LQDPGEKLEAIMRSNPGMADLEALVITLVSTGFQRDLPHRYQCPHPSHM